MLTTYEQSKVHNQSSHFAWRHLIGPIFWLHQLLRQWLSGSMCFSQEQRDISSIIPDMRDSKTIFNIRDIREGHSKALQLISAISLRCTRETGYQVMHMHMTSRATVLLCAAYQWYDSWQMEYTEYCTWHLQEYKKWCT